MPGRARRSGLTLALKKPPDGAKQVSVPVVIAADKLSYQKTQQKASRGRHTLSVSFDAGRGQCKVTPGVAWVSIRFPQKHTKATEGRCTPGEGAYHWHQIRMLTANRTAEFVIENAHKTSRKISSDTAPDKSAGSGCGILPAGPGATRLPRR